jgi:hypothetical protein
MLAQISIVSASGASNASDAAKVILAANLLSGRSKSCGCIAYDKARARMKTLLLVEKFANGLTLEEAKAQIGSLLPVSGIHKSLAEMRADS